MSLIDDRVRPNTLLPNSEGKFWKIGSPAALRT